MTQDRGLTAVFFERRLAALSFSQESRSEKPFRPFEKSVRHKKPRIRCHEVRRW